MFMADFAPQIALDPHFLLDDVAQASDLIVGQVTDARVRVDRRALQDLLTRGQPDAIDVRQRPSRRASRVEYQRLQCRAIVAAPSLRLALPRLMLRVRTNDAHDTAAPDNFAALAARLDGC